MANNTNNKKPAVDLASLYPTPKTYDEKQAERTVIDAKKEARQPQHVGILAAASLSIVFVYTLWMIATIPGLVFGSPMFGVPASLVLCLVWGGFVLWIVKDILRMFEIKGYAWMPFFVVYGACVSLLVALGNMTGLSILSLLGVTLIHFLVVCLIMGVAYTNRLPVFWKIAMLAGVWTIAFSALIILSLNNMV
jgi:hypothetical protein